MDNDELLELPPVPDARASLCAGALSGRSARSKLPGLAQLEYAVLRGLSQEVLALQEVAY